MTPPEKLEYLDDDELPTPIVGPWTKEKYRVVRIFNEIFSTGMKEKWHRAYIDLFAGAGKARIKGTNKFLAGSPLLALSVSHPYDKYIFCEKDKELMKALKSRVGKGYSQVDVKFVDGDCNEKIDESVF